VVSALVGKSKRGNWVGEESRSSTEAMGTSLVLVKLPGVCCWGESFLFFVEDVVKASCLCSSGEALKEELVALAGGSGRW